MTEQLERKILRYVFLAEHTSRREFNQAVKKRWGEEAYRVAKDLWKRGFLSINAWGYVSPTKRFADRMIELNDKERERGSSQNE